MDNELNRNLKNRHIQLIALGCAIGTGLFYGSANVIASAGPAVILSYAVGGFFVFLVMRAMGEMSVHTPVSGAFSTFAYKYWGELPGFFSGWNYWFCYVAVSMAEISVVGMYINFWLPDVPHWVTGLIVFILINAINLSQVKVFGEIEFWGAIVKVVAILLMIFFGLLIILFGIGNGGQPVGFSNLFMHGGFFPNGITGILMSLVAVTFAFGGTELVGITAGEADNPQKNIPKAINLVLLRIIIFYVGAMFVLVSLYNWSEVGRDGSPFVMIFSNLGIPAAAAILNFIVLTATLSAYNSCLYSNARMLFALARQGNAPKFLNNLNRHGVPHRCVFFSSSFVLVVVGLIVVLPDMVFGYVMSIASLAIIINWLMILYTQLRFRKITGKEKSKELLFKMPLFPVSNYITFAYLGMVIVLMAISPATRISIYLAPFWIAAILIAFKIKTR